MKLTIVTLRNSIFALLVLQISLVTSGFSYQNPISAIAEDVALPRPNAPTSLVATPGNSQVTVAFREPVPNGGASITNYEYKVDAGDWVAFDPPTSVSPVAVTGLSNGTPYVISLRAVNSSGGGELATVSATPHTTPGAPMRAALGSSGMSENYLNIYFSPPASDGGSPITNYEFFNQSGAWVEPPVVSSIFGMGGNNIKGLAVDSLGNLYSSNSGDDSVSKFSTNGTVRILGTTGHVPLGIAVDSAGNVYTTNLSDNTVSKISPSGQTSIFGVTDNSPCAIVVDSQGNVYTANNGSDSVTKISSNGISSYYGSTGRFPYSIAIDAQGNIYTTNAGDDTVTKITPERQQSTIATSLNPHGIAVDKRGYVYVANGDATITRIAPDGTSIIWARVGRGSEGIAVDDAGNVYIASGVNGTVSKFSTNGIRKWTSTVGADPRVIAVDPFGNVYTANYSSKEVTKLGTQRTSPLVVYKFGGSFRAVNAAGAGMEYSADYGELPTRLNSPTQVAATPGDRQVSIAFTAPALNGTAEILNYEYRIDAGEWVALSPPRIESPIVISDLNNGVNYGISLRAVNEAGGGDESSSVSVTPRTTAEAPSTLVATPGNAQASIAFDVPWSTGGTEITNYEFSTDNGVTWKAFSPATNTSPVVITTRSDAIAALINGREYQIKLRALNAAGRGAVSSSVAVTPRTTPDAPYWSAARPGNVLVLISFTAPSSNGGSAITNYEYSTDNGTSWKALSPADTTSPVSFSVRSDSAAALVNGVTYQVKMRAVNAAGPGASSSEMAATPRTTADAPTSLVALPGDAQATVEFMAPISNGGAAITNYEYTTDNGTTWKAFNPAVVSSPVVITTGSNSSLALGNGARYKIGLRAVNEAGSGDSSSRVFLTPGASAGAPESLVATPGDAQATIAFTAPSSIGGIEITNYEYSTDMGATWKALSPVDAVSPIVIAYRSDASTALLNGNLYYISLRAVNAAGIGTDSSSVSVTPRTTASAPRSLVATQINAQASIAFDVPWSTGGASITNYEFSTDNGVTWKAFSPADFTTPVVITTRSDAASGLVGGIVYNVKLRAVNAAGSGAESSAVSVSLRLTPGAPRSLVATAGDASVSVTFAAPVSDGGAAILEYIVRAVPTSNGQTKSCSTTTTLRCELTNLVNNIEYTVVVVARNSVGESVSSNSVSIYPFATPSAQVLQSLPESLVITNSSPAPGESINLSFSGFTPFEWVVITLQSTPTVLNSLQADSSGVITTSVVLPSSTSLGGHTLSLLGLTSGAGARRSITVSSAAQSSFISLSEPKRVVDTRGGGRFGSTSSSKVSVKRVKVFGATTTDGGATGLPSSGIGAVSLNVTAVNGFDAGGYGFVTVYPCESDSTVAPNSSNLNFAGGQTIPNAVIAPVSSNGYVCFSVYGNTDLLVDVSGYFL